MPSYTEGDNIHVIIDHTPSMIKPILFASYEAITKYNIHIIYEDSTTKDVELVQKDKERPYKFTFKKNGELHSVIGIPTIYEINEGNKFCDFVNKTMDSDDLLFVVDCSDKFSCNKVKFYLKDIRDIVDLVTEGSLEDPNDNIGVYPYTVYPIYLNNQSCASIIECQVDDNLEVTLTSMITKLGEPLPETEYSNFTIVSVDGLEILPEKFENNKVPLRFEESRLDQEIKIILKYFIKEINHPVFDEFTIIAHKKSETGDETDSTIGARKAATTQDMQYLGDGLKPALGGDLTPGYKEFRYKKEE